MPKNKKNINLSTFIIYPTINIKNDNNTYYVASNDITCLYISIHNITNKLTIIKELPPNASIYDFLK